MKNEQIRDENSKGKKVDPPLRKPFVVDDPSRIPQPPLEFDTKPKNTIKVQRIEQSYNIR